MRDSYIRAGEKPANGHDKSGTSYDPDVAHAAAFTNDDDLVAPGDINTRKLMTKIDLRIIPVLSVLYLVQPLPFLFAGNEPQLTVSPRWPSSTAQISQMPLSSSSARICS